VTGGESINDDKENMKAIQLPRVESHILDNGLKILAVRDPRLPLVTIVLMVQKGAECDEEGRAGQADLALEMLTLGTQKRSSEAIALDIDSIGARLAFYAGWDASFIEIEGLSEDLGSLLEILSDLVLHPTFPRSEFDQLKERRIASLIQEQDESEIIADVQFTELIFQGTPYGHSRRGTVDSLREVSLGDLESFYNRTFLAGQCILLIVGEIGFDEAFRGTEAVLGSWSKGSDTDALAPFPLPRRASRQVRMIHRPDLTQSQIRLGHPGIERRSHDHHAFQVANYILGGGGFSSRLMETIRSQKGYTYGISSSFQGRRYPGPFMISTFTPNENILAVVQEVLEVVDGFIRGGVSPRELQEAKNFYLGSYPFRFETPRKIAREILEVELYGLGMQSLTDYPQSISRITQTDIHTVVQRRVFPEVFSVVVVGNCEAFKGGMERLGSVETIDFQTLLART
jgi:zinc protease